MAWSHPTDTWIAVIGCLCALSCSLLGNFLVLRRMSMMGDAISHAVLPGLAAGFILTGSRGGVTMLVGAALMGLVTALLTQWLHQFGGVDRGAAMGVVFTTLFAVGLILIKRAADHVDLDPGCVLYGLIEFTPLDTVAIGSRLIPRAAVILGGTLILNLIAVLVFYKELKISSFDPALATTVGINATAMHYLLMTLVAVTTVASFESIGSILVIAMLIVPAATARLLTDRLWTMLLVSAAVGVVAAVSGHWAAFVVPGWLGLGATRTSGTMATMAGLIFTGAVLAAPRHGLVSKAWHRIRLSLQVVAEDVLGLLYRIEESTPILASNVVPTVLGGSSTAARTARRGEMVRTLRVGPFKAHLAMAALRMRGMVCVSGSAIGLTPTGRARAVDLVRSHRLWETYLSQHTPLATDHLHAPAEWLEHVTDPALQKRLDEATGRMMQDPQGKIIPPPSGGQDG